MRAIASLEMNQNLVMMSRCCFSKYGAGVVPAVAGIPVDLRSGSGASLNRSVDDRDPGLRRDDG
jgi:hypothetical protein